jgi:hypothetical protein
MTMITLYGFGPAFGLPDPSPFVMKAELLLKMAGLPYKADTGGMRKAPKGKLPYIVDDGEAVGDSTFIRWHIEKKYQIDFDRGLTPEQRAIAWAFEKMLEDHLYWAVVKDRWLNDANFAKGPRKFFRGLPAPLQPIVAAVRPAANSPKAARTGHGPSFRRGNHGACDAIDRGHLGLPREQALHDGRCTDGSRRHGVCVRRGHFVSRVRVANAPRGRASRQSQKLRGADDGPLLSRL